VQSSTSLLARGTLAVSLVFGCASCVDQSCASGTEKWDGERCQPPSAVHVNTVGFLPDHAKVATVLQAATTFALVRSDGTEALSGSATGPLHDGDTGMDLWTIDFSSFAEPGEYHLEVPGVGRSVSFRIDPNLYADVTKLLMLGMYGQRCGVPVELEHDGKRFSHGACHTRDAIPWEDRASGTVTEVSGGWHDAGDYGKYTNNAAFSLGMLLRAWELDPAKLATLALAIPEHGGPVPDFLSEARVQIDQLLKMQRDDGSVYQQVSEVSFEGFVSPTSDTGARYIFGAGTVQAADLVAVAAASARLFQPYDAEYAARCLAAAEKSWAYLQADGFVGADLSGTNHPGYGRRDDFPERLWAAAELWETTGDAGALAVVESKIATAQVASSWDWPNIGNLGVFTYVLSRRDGRDPTVLASVTGNVVSSAQVILAQISASGFGRGIASYYWGSNGSIARTALNLIVANRLRPDARFVDGVVVALDHLLGRNVFGRSFVTGLGHFPPVHPHHRPSASTGAWPGLLVGGPNGSATSWTDEQGVYQENEIAINWNTAMIFATVSLLP
jgi:endoglucanase